jgi:hypothetical protein
MADDDDDENDRIILSPKVGKDGLFVEVDDDSPERETVEIHNRERFATHFKYADKLCGLQPTFDEKGDYNCGRCNQADEYECLLVDIPRIDRDAGSCGDWEKIRKGDPELRLEKSDAQKSVTAAGYGVAANGKGFGCHRCPFASRAIRPDSANRDLYCGKGDFRVSGNACCVLNGAPLRKKLYDNPRSRAS